MGTTHIFDMSIMEGTHSAGVNGRATTDKRNLHSSQIVKRAVIQHATNSASFVTLDNWDWRYSCVKLSVMVFKSSPLTPDNPSPPASGSLASTSAESGYNYTAAGAVAFWSPTLGSATPVFQVNSSTGALEVKFNYDPVGGNDNIWFIEAERFLKFQ